MRDRHRRWLPSPALVGAGRWLLNPLFRLLAARRAREVMTAAALLVVLGAALAMQLGGLSMAMGAFLAGVLLSESTFRHQLEADIEPFRGILLGLFFLGVGMSLDLGVIAAELAADRRVRSSATWSLKALGIYVVARLTKSEPRRGARPRGADGAGRRVRLRAVSPRPPASASSTPATQRDPDRDRHHLDGADAAAGDRRCDRLAAAGTSSRWKASMRPTA